jgi:hypothetical protein
MFVFIEPDVSELVILHLAAVLLLWVLQGSPS